MVIKKFDMSTNEEKDQFKHCLEEYHKSVLPNEILYYWESHHSFGSLWSSDDKEGVVQNIKNNLSKGDELLIVYKESDTEDGLPFITLFCYR